MSYRYVARARLVPVASKLAGRVCSPRLDRRRTLLELALGRCLAARVQRRLERVQLLSFIESHAGAALVCLGLPPAQFEEPIARLQVRGALGALEGEVEQVLVVGAVAEMQHIERVE